MITGYWTSQAIYVAAKLGDESCRYLHHDVTSETDWAAAVGLALALAVAPACAVGRAAARTVADAVARARLRSALANPDEDADADGARAAEDVRPAGAVV